MTKRLDGKVVIVTGGSEGIGRSIAARSAAEGAHVAIAARRPDPLAAAERAIRDSGGSIEARQLDVGDIDAFTAYIREIAERHGRLDGLVNNAFAFTHASIEDTSIESWSRDFHYNAHVPFAGVREAMRIMTAQGAGSIVNIATINALLAAPNHASYSASKAAMIHFSNVAAMEAAASGVRVNSVAPGMTLTEGMAEFMKSDPEGFARIRDSIPMQRGCHPDEVANAVVFLLSDESSYITAACLPVDGGKSSHLWLPH